MCVIRIRDGTGQQHREGARRAGRDRARECCHAGIDRRQLGKRVKNCRIPDISGVEKRARDDLGEPRGHGRMRLRVRIGDDRQTDGAVCRHRHGCPLHKSCHGRVLAVSRGTRPSNSMGAGLDRPDVQCAPATTLIHQARRRERWQEVESRTSASANLRSTSTYTSSARSKIP